MYKMDGGSRSHQRFACPTLSRLEKINRKEELVCETGAGVAEPGQSMHIGAICAGLKIPSRRGTWVRIPPPAPRLRAHYDSFATLFLRVPIFSISTSTRSPGERNFGVGFMNTATPAGVPVAIMSQGSSVITRLM